MITIDKRTFLIAGGAGVLLGASMWYFKKASGKKLAIWIAAGVVGGALVDTLIIKGVFKK